MRRCCGGVVAPSKLSVPRPLCPTHFVWPELRKKFELGFGQLIPFTLPPTRQIPGSSRNGCPEERKGPQGARGQDGRWHGQCQGQGHQLLPVCSCAFLSLRQQTSSYHTFTNSFPAMRRRSRSLSASQTARLSATPRETSPRLLSTKTAMRLLPVSSPTGSGSTTRE